MKEVWTWLLGWAVYPMFVVACNDQSALSATRVWLRSRPDAARRQAAHEAIGRAL